MIERRKHYCQQQDLLREMHGDIKGIAIKVDNISNSVNRHDDIIEGHIKDSNKFRRKVDLLWIMGKGLMILAVNGGLVWKIIEWIGG